MKFRVEQEVLEDLLATTHPAAVGGFDPVNRGVRIEAVDGRVHAAASDLDLAIRTVTEAAVEDPGVVVVPSVVARNVVGVLGAGVVEVTADDDTLHFSGNEGEADVRIIPVDNWFAPAAPDGDAVEFTADQVDAMRRVIYAASNDVTRPFITGMLFDDHYVSCTDSYRGAIVDLGVDLGLTSNVPAATMRAVLAAVEGQPIRMVFGEQRVSVTAENTSWTVSLIIEDKIPRLTPFLRAADAGGFTVNRGDFSDAAAAMSALEDQFEIARAHLSGDGGVLTLEKRNVDTGALRRHLDIVGDCPEVACRPQFIRDMAKNCRGDELVVGVVGNNKPIIVNDDDTTHIIMPIK